MASGLQPSSALLGLVPVPPAAPAGCTDPGPGREPGKVNHKANEEDVEEDVQQVLSFALSQDSKASNDAFHSRAIGRCAPTSSHGWLPFHNQPQLRKKALCFLQI